MWASGDHLAVKYKEARAAENSRLVTPRRLSCSGCCSGDTQCVLIILDVVDDVPLPFLFGNSEYCIAVLVHLVEVGAVLHKKLEHVEVAGNARPVQRRFVVLVRLRLIDVHFERVLGRRLGDILKQLDGKKVLVVTRRPHKWQPVGANAVETLLRLRNFSFVPIDAAMPSAKTPATSSAATSCASKRGSEWPSGMESCDAS